nr:MgtC/SapB family protein [Aneurinibacillus terranovensis]
MDIFNHLTQYLTKYEHLEMYIRLLLSAIFGFAIGLERSSKSKPAGIKTYSFVCVASTLLTLVSIYAVQLYSIPGHTTMDPMRLAAQIVSGLGFLGAGLIIHQGQSIHGLTSAAMIFFAGGIGIAVGAGFYGMTAFSMVVMYTILRLGERFEKKQKTSGAEDEDTDH